jgi:cytochrome c biogenesis protein CcdA/thiol-disulfide isomerase/thioredoxin
VLQAPDGCAARDLWLPRSFAAHANADVAAAALRLLASHGLKDPGSRVCLLRVLREAKSDELAFTVLDALEVDDNVSAVLRDEAAGAPAADEPRTETTPAQPAGAAKGVLDAFGADPDSLPSAPPATPAGADGGSPAEAALDAFLEPGQRAAPAPTAPATPADTPAAGAAGVLAAFGVDGAEQPAPVVGDTPGSVSLRELGLAAMAYLEPKYPERTRRAAALFVTGLGSRAGLPVLEAGLAQATAAERQRVARLLRLPQASRIAGVEALLRVLVDDFAENVRREAVAACLGASRSALINLPFATLMHPDARLRPWDLLTFWGSGSREGATAIAECFRRWARTLVADADPARQTLGLILLERVWQQGDAETVVPFLTAATPWQRRAAAGALGRRAPPAFQEHLAALAADPSEHVRIVLPLVYGKDDDQWVDYVDAEHFGSSFFRVHSFRGSERKPAALPPAVVTVLEGLTRDPVPRVRLEAFLCLLEHRVSVDLARLAATVEALPERKAASGRVASFVGENYRQLGPPFRLLLPYLEGTWQGESMREELNKHFGVSDDTPMPTASPPRLLRPDRPAAVAAEFLPELQTPVEGAARPPVALVYFHSPGCSECERVARLLEELQRAFPNLTVEAHSIRKLAAVRLNEALCQRFAVPEPLRLVTPAVFCSAGPLIRQEITFASLNDKVNRSLGGRREDWITVTPEDLEEAEQAVQDRYAAFRAGVVVAAGLLDGVNPCAFATIIFLLSYLQLAKRRPREIAQVGLAFIAGVFLAYVGLGLGLTEIVARLQVLRQVSRGLNLALAAFVLIVAMLSIRDGVLCLQGRLAAITLQLPDVLKRRIHRAVREGSRQRHFVLAAFVVGVLISFLELACTGQVYAPTIVFMLKSGRDLAGALRYLLLYNLAFVAPLLLIFALAFGGLRSAALTGFLQRHAATVKFATAALFLVLFVLFVFGHRLPYLAG